VALPTRGHQQQGIATRLSSPNVEIIPWLRLVSHNVLDSGLDFEWDALKPSSLVIRLLNPDVDSPITTPLADFQGVFSMLGRTASHKPPQNHGSHAFQDGIRKVSGWV
jgi:hypothetical protein